MTSGSHASVREEGKGRETGWAGKENAPAQGKWAAGKGFWAAG